MSTIDNEQGVMINGEKYTNIEHVLKTIRTQYEDALIKFVAMHVLLHQQCNLLRKWQNHLGQSDKIFYQRVMKYDVERDLNSVKQCVDELFKQSVQRDMNDIIYEVRAKCFSA